MTLAAPGDYARSRAASTSWWLRVRRGDDRAFEVLFSRYDAGSARTSRAWSATTRRAEDITQEVFMSALRRMRDTERAIAFKPWIYEIAKNACIDEFRRTRRSP